MLNTKISLNNGEWLAVVFANRNQNYGAYMLRKYASLNLLKAFAIVVPIFIMAFVGPAIISGLDNEIAPSIAITPIQIADKLYTIEEIKPRIKEEQQTAPQTEKVKTIGMNANIKVVPDKSVVSAPPTTSELKDAVIGSVDIDGPIGIKQTVVGEEDVIGGSGAGVGNGNGNEVLEVAGVQVFPEFPGGMEAWAKFIQRNLKYPILAQEANVQGKVFLSFIVEKDGTISNVSVVRGIGYGCDDEAIRVIKKSPKWKVGMNNNLPVRVKYNMPISYILNN